MAENAGGVHCLKYGLTVHNVLSVAFLTLDGELCETGGPTLDAPGYDLLALLTGSEGLLGTITSITVKLLPRPAGTLRAGWVAVVDQRLHYPRKGIGFQPADLGDHQTFVGSN